MTLEDTIRDLSHQLRSSERDDLRAAAVATGGAQVYADMGGILVILESGDVVCFDPDTSTIQPVTDIRWRAVAIVHGARKFPALARLLPPRPTGAIVCGGSGTVFGNVTCGTCFGLGWLDSDGSTRQAE